MLLSFPAYLQAHPRVEQDVKASTDYLLSLQTKSGNFPCATDELGVRARPESDELVHWCHGAPGNLLFCRVVMYSGGDYRGINFFPLPSIVNE
jgi:hypothetical protein